MAKSNNSTLKALEVLELLAAEENGLRLTDVAQGTAYPLSTVRRLLVSLIERGYVDQDPETNRYFLGTKILTLQAQGFRHRHIVRLAYPHLRQLQRQLDETVNFGVLVDRSVVYIETLAPESSFAFYAPPGTRLPLHCTAMGKLFLAHLSPPALDEMLASLEFKQFTPQTAPDAETLRPMLNKIAQDGYAIDQEEYARGVQCFAAPIYARDARHIASVSVTFLATSRSAERQAEALAELRSTCAQISATLGHQANALS